MSTVLVSYSSEEVNPTLLSVSKGNKERSLKSDKQIFFFCIVVNNLSLSNVPDVRLISEEIGRCMLNSSK